MPVNAQSLLAFVRKVALMTTSHEARRVQDTREEPAIDDAELLAYLIYEARSILKDKP